MTVVDLVSSHFCLLFLVTTTELVVTLTVRTRPSLLGVTSIFPCKRPLVSWIILIYQEYHVSNLQIFLGMFSLPPLLQHRQVLSCPSLPELVGHILGLPLFPFAIHVFLSEDSCS